MSKTTIGIKKPFYAFISLQEVTGHFRHLYIFKATGWRSSILM